MKDKYELTESNLICRACCFWDDYIGECNSDNILTTEQHEQLYKEVGDCTLRDKLIYKLKEDK